MPVRAFQLDGSGSQIVSIAQEGAGAALTVLLNGRVLGTLAASKKQSASSDFTLDDGSILTVRTVGKQVQVRHNGLPLFAARSRQAAARVVWTKRIMLTCAITAPLMGMVSLFISLLALGACYHNADCATNPIIGNLPSALLGAGFVLLLLIACVVGILSALATRHWKWLVYGFGPLLLLQIVSLIGLLALIQGVGYSPHDLVTVLEDVFVAAPLELVSVVYPLGVSSWLASVACLIYAVRLD